ncbi:BsuBI/PstI family type II restriction endonuclease [Sinomonas sp. ASV486]|uniref:BsuBI/PstI family type II restriction endonuclease n=1 Tax=Sinomonas sp. ASV486 TaxID=3051170 RepID=UPI0027DAEC28|nr:BsuBI/PstI family type II restriction endonuclease [Sinomonas sp. ASV486]MDQ4490729.1 BsuBI/PstI family type II restriction endonuclease [Sinomonas sp. ASV486]
MNANDIVAEARILLGMLGMDAERTNERSALTFLALLHLRPGDPWSAAASPMLGTRAIMDWIRDEYQREYAANTRETIRRFTLHQFGDALLVQQNPDRPDRPVNSPKWNYQVTPQALAVIQKHGTAAFGPALIAYLSAVPGLKVQYAAAREMNRIPITLPNGQPFTLSPGGQNVLIKQMVEEFCPQFTPGGEVLYIGDADAKWAHFEKDGLEALGVAVDEHGKMPDLVVHLPDRQWLVLMEAASSHGPVDAKRHSELAALFADASPGLVYVSCFPDRREMRKYLHQIAWETEVWCAEDPSHLIHFNGERFLGPYD